MNLLLNVRRFRRRPRLSHRLLHVVLIGFLLPSSAPVFADGIAMLKDYLKGLNSLSAEFRQITMTSGGASTLEASGTFYLMRPGRFRWEYRTPSEQLIVADGTRVYVHDLELEQVTHQSEKKALDGTPAQLLASNEPVDKYFRIRNFDRGDQRTWVELVPKDPDTQVERLQIGFSGGELDTLVMEDRFGQLTRLIFTDIDRNPQLQYSMFRFKRPPGGDFLQID